MKDAQSDFRQEYAEDVGWKGYICGNWQEKTTEEIQKCISTILRDSRTHKPMLLTFENEDGDIFLETHLLHTETGVIILRMGISEEKNLYFKDGGAISFEDYKEIWQACNPSLRWEKNSEEEIM